MESFRVGVPSILFFLISDSLGGFNTCLNGQIERQIDREHHQGTDNGHPERAFFQKFETFGLGQTNWAEILGGILAISSQTIGTILAL